MKKPLSIIGPGTQDAGRNRKYMKKSKKDYINLICPGDYCRSGALYMDL